MRSLLLTLFLSQYFSTLFPFALAASVNQTIDDSDIVFNYAPGANWQRSNNASCATCLQPDAQFAFQKTLHYAIHASGPDADDLGKTSLLSPSASEASILPSSASAPPPSSASTPPSSSQAPSSTASPSSSSSSSAPSSSLAVVPAAPITNQAIAPPSTTVFPAPSSTDDGSGKGKGKGGLSSRQLAKLRRADADDPNFVDMTMTATVNFTGSAFYVFCALPVQINNDSILTLTNLTFFLDDRLVGNFTHDTKADTGSTTGFQYQVMVFSKVDIAYAPHVLVIKPELGSMVLLDYVQYTTLETASATNGTPQATSSGSVDSQKSTNPSKTNTATFAVAIGSTLGVLAILCFSIFISICIRRRRSAKREKLREDKEAANRPPSPEMRGPQPFIPRYFSGNTPPRPSASPPPFPPLSTTSSSSEESGPSHGLDFPPAPEHLDAPAYSPPPLVLSEHASIPVSLRPPVTRMPLPKQELDLPRYQAPLASIPMFTNISTLPPGLVDPSPSSSLRTGGGESPSSSLLFPGHHGESAAGRTIVSTIHANPDERPG